MLVTPNFVFIHIPKTAGRFCRQRIVENVPVLYRGGLHGPIQRLPDAFKQLPIIAFVRNPWDWYVSWYYHMQDFDGFNPLYANAVNAGKDDFCSVMNYVFDSIEEGTQAAANLDDYLNSPEHAQKQSHDLDSSMISYQREHNCSVLGWRYKFNIGEDDSVIKYIGKFEFLVEDLLTCLKNCGVYLDDKTRLKIHMARPVGEGEVRAKRDFRSLYTDEKLIERVAEKERFIIDKFGYHFE